MVILPSFKPLFTAKFSGAIKIACRTLTVSPKSAFKLSARRRLRALERVTYVPWSAPISPSMFSPALVACRPAFAGCTFGLEQAKTLGFALEQNEKILPRTPLGHVSAGLCPQGERFLFSQLADLDRPSLRSLAPHNWLHLHVTGCRPLNWPLTQGHLPCVDIR